MFTCRFVSVVASLFVVHFAFSPARADWTICNKTAEEYNVAIAYEQGRGHVSEGWWTLRPCGGCKVVHQGRFAVAGAFLRGEGKEGSVAEGNNLFCVTNRAFTISGAGNCRNRGYSERGFTLHRVTGDYTTNITGRSPSGRVCID
jgi:uncharacterized membrane protein